MVGAVLQEMQDFVTARLQTSGRYDVYDVKDGHIHVATRSSRAGIGVVDIVLHDKRERMTRRELIAIMSGNNAHETYTGNIFYGDGVEFRRRLAARAHHKREKSLKNYEKPERDSELDLSLLEKTVLITVRDELAYYQPETERLEQSIRVYKLSPTQLNYSHIKRGDPGFGFARNKEAERWRLAAEIARVTEKKQLIIYVSPHDRVIFRAVPIPVPIPPRQLPLFEGTLGQVSSKYASSGNMR